MVELTTGMLKFIPHIHPEMKQDFDPKALGAIAMGATVKSDVLVALSIPTKQSLSEFLAFVQDLDESILEGRVAKTSIPQFYAIILRFTSSKDCLLQVSLNLNCRCFSRRIFQALLWPALQPNRR